jgi:hypothetical protein
MFSMLELCRLLLAGAVEVEFYKYGLKITIWNRSAQLTITRLRLLLHVPNVNDVVERELTSFGRDFYEVPRLVGAWETSGFDSSSIFLTEGLIGGADTGIGVYHFGGPESSFRFKEPSGVFTSEMSVIFVALIQIRARRSGRYLVVTDSMTFLRTLQTHSLVNEIKEAC